MWAQGSGCFAGLRGLRGLGLCYYGEKTTETLMEAHDGTGTNKPPNLKCRVKSRR